MTNKPAIPSGGGGGGTIPANVLTTDNFNSNTEQLVGSVYIRSLSDYLDNSDFVSPTERRFKPNLEYVFLILLNVGNITTDVFGASLVAGIPGAGIQSTSTSGVFKSEDNNVFIGTGFLVLGDPSGNTPVFDFTNPTNLRNSFICNASIQNNNAKSTVSDFQTMSMGGSISNCSAGFEFMLDEAKSVVFSGLIMNDNNTSPILINMPNEAPAGASINVLACNMEPDLGDAVFYIENATAQAAIINFAANINTGDGDVLQGATGNDNNVYIQDTPTLPNTGIRGTIIMDSVGGETTSLTLNTWSDISGAFVYQSVVGQGTALRGTNEMEVTKPVRNEIVKIFYTISAEVPGFSGVFFESRVTKSTDGGLNFNQIGSINRFETRISAQSTTFDVEDAISGGDIYRIEIRNISSGQNVTIFTAKLSL